MLKIQVNANKAPSFNEECDKMCWQTSHKVKPRFLLLYDRSTLPHFMRFSPLPQLLFA
jgi:hypothetical protein